MAIPAPAFIWGKGGRALTEEEIAREREIAEKLKASGVDMSPIGHWTQGAARLAQALVGNMREARADRAADDNASYNSSLIQSLLGGGSASPAASGSSSAAMPMPGAAGEMAVTAPRKAGAGSTFSPFIETVKTGVELADGTKLAVTNPYALAAVAATGEAESGWSAGNANRTWSDPSESGQAGTAGGILSWRGPRYQALAKTGDLSPEGQARFFLQENPQLIAALNNASSVEEAQRLMNNAWRFAGYDRPGGEAARRLSLARGYLPQFQGGTEVASIDPSSGVTTAYVDPVVSAPNYRPETATAAIEAVSPTGSAPPLDPPVEVASLPVAGVPMEDTQPAQVKAAPPVQVAGGGGRIGDYGELNPALLQALTDPRASPQTQRVAAMLYEQHVRQQQAIAERQEKLASPEYQIEMATKKAQLEKLNRELNTQGYDGVTVGNRIVDRNTGKVIYETPREQFRAATPEEAQGFGAPAGQFGPDGRFYPLNPPSGLSVTTGPDGQVTFQQGPGAGVAKPLTEVQSKDVLYATRATNAMPIIDQYEDELLSLGGSLAEGIPMNLGNYAQSEQYQLARDAGRDFLATILRKDTGAAITSNEEQIYGKMFLPQPGDKPATVQAKRQRRALAVEAIKAGMPLSAIENMTKALGSVEPSTAPQDRGGTGAQKRLKFNPATGELE